MPTLLNLSDNVRADVLARLKPGAQIYTRTDLSSILVFTAWAQAAKDATRIAAPGSFLGTLKRILTLSNGAKQVELDYPGKVRVVGLSSVAIPATDQAVTPELRRAQVLYNNDKALVDKITQAATLVASARAAGKNVDAQEKALTQAANNTAKRGQTLLAFLGIKTAGVNGLGWVAPASAALLRALPYLGNALSVAWVFFRNNAAASVATVVVGGGLIYGGVKLVDWLTPNETQAEIDRKAVDSILNGLRANGITVTPEIEKLVENEVEKHGETTTDNAETPGILGNAATILKYAAILGVAYLGVKTLKK